MGERDLVASIQELAVGINYSDRLRVYETKIEALRAESKEAHRIIDRDLALCEQDLYDAVLAQPDEQILNLHSRLMAIAKKDWDGPMVIGENVFINATDHVEMIFGENTRIGEMVRGIGEAFRRENIGRLGLGLGDKKGFVLFRGHLRFTIDLEERKDANAVRNGISVHTCFDGNDYLNSAIKALSMVEKVQLMAVYLLAISETSKHKVRR